MSKFKATTTFFDTTLGHVHAGDTFDADAPTAERIKSVAEPVGDSKPATAARLSTKATAKKPAAATKATPRKRATTKKPTDK